MKIKTLRNMAFDGVIAPIGTVLEVPTTFGQSMANQGRAEIVTDETEASLQSDDGRKFLVDEKPAKRPGSRKPKPAAATGEPADEPAATGDKPVDEPAA